MRVLLIQMPFFTLDTPSISLSLLKAALDRSGLQCDLKYFNVDFGERLGVDLYSWIAGSSPPYLLFGDLVFAPSLHDTHISIDRLRALIAPLGTPGVPQVPEAIIDRYPDIVEAAHRFLDDKLRETDWSNYQLVGFSTMFQIAPALAMARRVKSLANSPAVILGGSYCEGEMGEYLHRSFPWIDYICRGEGEHLIVELARALADGGGSVDNITGLVWRDDQATRCNGEKAELHPEQERATAYVRLSGNGKPPTPTEYELDVLPTPKYDNWMEQVKASKLLNDNELRMPIETGRGCWYGEKHHCTFCGLNGGTIAFRRKSPERALAEFRELISTGVRMIHSVDDILDFRYFKTLLPELAKLRHGVEIFYEIKANLTHDQIRLLRDAGIVWIQPGIESLSTPMLELMDKGITAFQNVRLLRYTAEFGIGTAWNLLYGFPREDPQQFQMMAELLPSLSHLQPPYIECCQVRIHRFSPLYVKRDCEGLTDVAPTPAYYEFYPFEREVVARMAYYFGHGYASQPDPNSYIGPLAAAVKRWHNVVGSAAFLSIDRDESLHLIDTRPIAAEARAELRGLERDVFQACIHGSTLRALTESLGRGVTEITAVLDSYLERHWMLRLDGKFLTLAVPMDHFVPRYVPLSMVEPSLVARYCAHMERIHQGNAPHVPSFERLGASLDKARAPAAPAVAHLPPAPEISVRG